MKTFIKFISLNYFIIFYILIWEVFQKFIIKTDGAARSVAFLILLAIPFYFFFNRFRKVLVSKPVILWTMWIIYSFINTTQIGFSEQTSLSIFLQNLITPLIIMIFVAYGCINNNKFTFNLIVIALYIFTFIAFINASLQYERLGGAINSNTLGLTSLMLIYFIFGQLTYKRINITLFILLSAFPTIVLLMSGSRKSFGGLIIILISLLISKLEKNLFKTISLIAVGGIVTYVFILFAVTNTNLGARIENISDEAIATGYGSTNSFNYLGDRTYFYYLGWELFLENPINGIGLKNFSKYSREGIQNHSEYMIHLTEGGLIGSMFFLMFYLWFGYKLFVRWKKDILNRKITIFYVSGFLLILFLNLTVWTYSYPIFFLYFGVSLYYLNKNLHPNIRY